MRSVGYVVLGIASTLLVTAAASADDTAYFAACDGYGAPTSNGDGMTQEATGLFGIFRPLGTAGNTRRITPTFGVSGAASCDSALANPRLLDRYWLRRVSLLRARAIHDLAVKDVKMALADLDRAEAAVRVPDDALMQRSLGLGTRLVRAYALRRSGRADEAQVLLGAALAARPFDRRLALGAVAIASDETIVVNGEPLIWKVARLSPTAADRVAILAFNNGEFARYAALYPQLSPPIRVPNIGGPRYLDTLQASRNAAIAVMYNANRQGRLAYAFAATGQGEAAKTELAAARAALVASNQVPMPAPDPAVRESRRDREKRAETNYVAAAAAAAAKDIELWTRITGMRLAAASGKPAFTLVQLAELPHNGASLDLLMALKQASPPSADIDIAISAERDRLRPIAADHALEIRLLFESLPHAEIGQRAVPYKQAQSALAAAFWGGVSGFKTLADDGGGGVTVRFISQISSVSVVEEMALLRAADLARTAGRGGMIIRSRRDYERTTNTVYYGSVLRSDPDGYSSELDVEFVDLKSPPAKYRAAQWRVLDVAQVLATLEPIYIGAAQAAAARTRS